jgi:PBP1b-binding outer membrane lipoprotein LpoB
MMKTLIAAGLVAVMLAGCVVYPAHPVYYRGPVVVY